MASIRDFLSGIFWKIDSTSQAGRVTLYDTTGTPVVGTENSSVVVSLSALSAVVSIQMAGHNSCGLDITNMGNAGNVITIEGSVNGNWVTIPAINATTNNATPTIT